MMPVIRVALLAASLSGCVGTYPASVSGSIPDIMFLSTPSRVYAVGLSIDASDERFSTFAFQEGFVCTAHRYPVDVGTATAESVEAILSMSFDQVLTEPSSNYRLQYVIEPDYIEATMTGTLESLITGAYTADVEISLLASVYDQHGLLLLKQHLLGHGSARSEGSVCPKAAIAVGDAATLALHEALDDFVRFVTLSLDRSPEEQEPRVATDAVFGMLSTDLRDINPDVDKNGRKLKFVALDPVGKPKKLKGYAVEGVGLNSTFRIENGGVYSVPPQ